jgi:hypothetical protein
MGGMNASYPNLLAENYRANWFARTLYGKGEVTVLDNAYEEFALAIFNRLRGYDLFRRVVIVKDRSEADSLRATHLLTFRINDCYAVGSGANWNFVNWMSYESFLNLDVAVYDLVENQRVFAERINVNANDTSIWSTPDVRDYLRRQLLKGVTFNNAISEITF